MTAPQQRTRAHPETDILDTNPSRWVLDETADGSHLGSHSSWIVTPRWTDQGLEFTHHSDFAMSGVRPSDTPLHVLELLSTCDQLKVNATSKSRTKEEVMTDARGELMSLINKSNRETAESWIERPRNNYDWRGYTPVDTLMFMLPEEHNRNQYIRRLGSFAPLYERTVVNDPVSTAFEYYREHGVTPSPAERPTRKRTRIQM
jgi:hypothetical protein